MMTREEKMALVNELKETFKESPNFYLLDIGRLKGDQNNLLRRKLFEKNLKIKVVKNTLLRKALEAIEEERRSEGSAPRVDFEAIKKVLQNNTAIIFAYNEAAVPAKVLKAFREEGNDSFTLKAACVEGEVYVGDDQLEELARLKSKEELLSDLMGLLQSPMLHLISALQSGASNIHGILTALEKKEES
jgi:large subunit ribosomal protein L10